MGLDFLQNCDGGDTKMTKMTSAAVRKAVSAHTGSHSQVHLMKSGSQPEVDNFIFSTIQVSSIQQNKTNPITTPSISSFQLFLLCMIFTDFFFLKPMAGFCH
jgi:hypothetical protein